MEHFYIRTKKKFVQIKFAEIFYVEALRNYVKLYCEDKYWIVHIMICDLEELFPREQFKRVHRSYMVAIDKVKEFDKYGIVLTNGIRVPIGKAYFDQFIGRLLIVDKLELKKRQLEELSKMIKQCMNEEVLLGASERNKTAMETISCNDSL